MQADDIGVLTEGLSELVWNSDRDGAEAWLAEISPTDLALVVSRLDASDRCELLKTLDPPSAASVLEIVKGIEPHKILAQLAPETAAEILHELPSDFETDLIASMKPAAAERVLELLPSREVNDVRTLARYDADVAGGLMVTEILDFPLTETVQGVIDNLRTNHKVYSRFNIQYIYVVGDNRSLVGVLRVRDLLLSDSDTILGDLVVGDPVPPVVTKFATSSTTTGTSACRWSTMAGWSASCAGLRSRRPWHSEPPASSAWSRASSAARRCGRFPSRSARGDASPSSAPTSCSISWRRA